MRTDPNAETFEIPVLRMTEQMNRIAARSRRDERQERLYDPMTVTQSMPVVQERHRHRKPSPRLVGVRKEVVVLVAACAALIGGGAVIRIMATAPDLVIPAADNRPVQMPTTSVPQPVQTTPRPTPTILMVPVAEATPTKAAKPSQSPSRTPKVPASTKAAVKPVQTPQSPTAAPESTPSPTVEPTPTPTATPSPTPSADPVTPSPEPTPLVSISVLIDL